MQTTKGQILALLKRNGSSSVEDLASALGLSSVTVRQHLTALERDALVHSQEVRRPTGRPHYVYTLTDAGHNAFPGHYERQIERILWQVAQLDDATLTQTAGPARLQLVVQRLADSLAQELEPWIEGRPLAERVGVVADILKREGGFAEWGRIPQGFEIRDYNCVYRRVLEAYGFSDCQWHSRFLSRLLGPQVRSESLAECVVYCCRYVVPVATEMDTGPTLPPLRRSGLYE